jgi:hypothetical protein
MDKLFHDFDFLEGLLNFKGINMNFLQGVTTVLCVFGKIDRAEASLSDEVDHFVLGVHWLVDFND